MRKNSLRGVLHNEKEPAIQRQEVFQTEKIAQRWKRESESSRTSHLVGDVTRLLRGSGWGRRAILRFPTVPCPDRPVQPLAISLAKQLGLYLTCFNSMSSSELCYANTVYCYSKALSQQSKQSLQLTIITGFYYLPIIDQWYPKCDLRIINITLELVRNPSFQATPRPTELETLGGESSNL